jgi:hypothetical protein
MGRIETKRLNTTSDETQRFEKGKNGYYPHWWHNNWPVHLGVLMKKVNWIKLLVKAGRCQQHYTGYVISGWMKVRMNDGIEKEFGAGKLALIPKVPMLG